MYKKATLLLPTGIELDLEDLDLTLGSLIQLVHESFDHPAITPDRFGALKDYFFVNSSTGCLIDANLDLKRPLSTLFIGDRDVIELRLCDPSPRPDGTVINPMRGVTRFVK